MNKGGGIGGSPSAGKVVARYGIDAGDSVEIVVPHRHVANSSLILPEILEALRRQLSITDRVLDVLVPEVELNRPGVLAGVAR